MTIKEKELALNGKRYSTINDTIKKSLEQGIKVSHEQEIELHYAWMLTIKRLKKHLKDT